MKLLLLKSIILGSLSLSALGSDKPNIIYINVDDLGWADVGYQGSTFYETPHIDKLATQGMVFANAYAAAANCAPSRACAITGQATPRHGVYTVLNSDRGASHTRKIIPTKNTLVIKQDNLTLGHAMKQAGYVTGSFGKWHVSNDPLKNGFDVNVGGSTAGGPYVGGYHSPFKYPNLVQNNPGEYLTDRLTTEAIQFVTDNKDKAFFLYLPYFTVHTPIQGKKDKIAYFKKKDPSDGQKNASYAAMISSLDDNIGRLMKTLDELKLADNTIVIFTSDNGGVYNISHQTPLRAGKGSYYEGGIREPFIVRWPAKFKPSKNDTPVTHLDLFPTFLDVTQTKMPDKTLDGNSLIHIFNGKTDEILENRALYWHFPIYLQGGNKDCQDPLFRTRPGSAIRYGDWKLIQYFENNDLELYNLKNDLSEKSNLAAKNPEKVKQLLAMLDTWRTEKNAPVPTEINPDFGKKPAKKNKKQKRQKAQKT